MDKKLTQNFLLCQIENKLKNKQLEFNIQIIINLVKKKKLILHNKFINKYNKNKN
jgi:hypothetical protein